jgi:glucan phosphoethanolaminetransferase (alkaline phosphatase superfamily)
MIQRIQSIYLLLAALCSGLLLAAPLYSIETATAIYQLFLGGLVQTNPKETIVTSQPAMLAVGILLTLFPLVILFLYKKRQVQMRLSASAMMANTAMLLLLVGIVNKSLEYITEIHTKETYGGGLILPLLSIVFLFLANKAIRKDDKLIRSADRLR